MSDRTPIQWTDATWNPFMGCRRVSAGCEHCYAEQIAARFSGPGQPFEGIARRRSNGDAQWTGNSAVNERTMHLPLSWRAPRRIFVNSMSDVFYEQFSVEQIARVWAVMALAPRHTYQILTKRAERMRDVLNDPGFYRLVLRAAEPIRAGRPELNGVPISDPRHAAFWPHVWLGVSVEHQAAADERIPLLAQTPAAVRFLSCEPLLGPIDFYECGSRGADDGDPCAFSALTGLDGVEPPIPGIDWVIVGGESGTRARRLDLAWVRGIVDACRASRVPVFVKQLGRYPVELERGIVTWPDIDLRDSHGGDMSEWPADLRVRDFPVSASFDTATPSRDANYVVDGLTLGEGRTRVNPADATNGGQR